ncbi:MAG: hypothetical protein AAFY72_13360 [Cyanobacteria bacterium J06649_4]
MKLSMENNWVRLAILLSILLLIVFPFAGLAPLTLLFLVAVLGWAVRLANTVIEATASEETE